MDHIWFMTWGDIISILTIKGIQWLTDPLVYRDSCRSHRVWVTISRFWKIYIYLLHGIFIVYSLMFKCRIKHNNLNKIKQYITHYNVHANSNIDVRLYVKKFWLSHTWPFLVFITVDSLNWPHHFNDMRWHHFNSYITGHQTTQTTQFTKTTQTTQTTQITATTQIPKTTQITKTT